MGLRNPGSTGNKDRHISHLRSTSVNPSDGINNQKSGSQALAFRATNKAILGLHLELKDSLMNVWQCLEKAVLESYGKDQKDFNSRDHQ